MPPKEITQGWTISEATDRIISKGLELSADATVVSLTLTFKKNGSASVPHMKIKFPGSAAVEYELDGKIPPSTGVKVKKRIKKRKS